MPNPAVFLDRDGVINRAIFKNGEYRPPWSVDEFEFIPGVIDALRLLRNAGHTLIVVTNQPDVARGQLLTDTLQSIHRHMNASFSFDGVYTCTHDDRDRCDCRKPLPGMLFLAARDHDIDLGRSFMIGDRSKDIEAGQCAGCRTILVRHSGSGMCRPDHTVGNLSGAVDIILKAGG